MILENYPYHDLEYLHLSKVSHLSLLIQPNISFKSTILVFFLMLHWCCYSINWIQIESNVCTLLCFFFSTKCPWDLSMLCVSVAFSISLPSYCIIWIYHNLCIYYPDSRQSIFCLFEDILNKAAMKILTDLLFWTYFQKTFSWIKNK